MKSRSKKSAGKLEGSTRAGDAAILPVAKGKSATATIESQQERLRQWLLAGLMALVVARPLVPSEGVSWLGDGLTFTLLLLMLAAAYGGLAIWRGELHRKLHVVDVAVGLLVSCCVASCLMGYFGRYLEFGSQVEFTARSSSQRVSINMLWEWVGLGLGYFLARQLVATRLESRAVVAVMIAVACSVSALGLYQVNVTMPADVAAYAADPDAVLRSSGQWFPEGSPERANFEARLASPEPVATFALTNSLAGFLVAWLVVALGATWTIVRNRPREFPNAAKVARYVGLAIGLTLIFICLALTRSRSAYVALAVGLLLLPLVAHRWRRAPVLAPSLKVLAIAGGVVAMLLVTAALLISRSEGGLLAEARKSLGYRLEYWDATLDMIAEFPLLGVGPGEFQNYYTRFKFPQASEEVRDPHNFILEAWATAGTPAFLAMLLVLVGVAWQANEAYRRPEEEPPEESATGSGIWLLLLGAVIGMPLAFAAGIPFGFYLSAEFQIVGVMLGGLAIASRWPWILHGELPRFLPTLGVLMLGVHWLASGGLTFPGVAGSFWLLMALSINLQTPRPVRAKARQGTWRRWGLAASLLGVLAMLFACYRGSFLPVLECRAALARAMNDQMTEATRLDAIIEASNADPLSVEPYRIAAQLSVQHLLTDPGSKDWQKRLMSAAQSIIRLDGHSSSGMRELADQFRQVYAVTNDPDVAFRVVDFTRTAAFLYPNSAVANAEYAIALHVLGRREESRRAATRALELNELTPHLDKKLPTAMREELLRELAEEPPAEEKSTVPSTDSGEVK